MKTKTKNIQEIKKIKTKNKNKNKKSSKKFKIINESEKTEQQTGK